MAKKLRFFYLDTGESVPDMYQCFVLQDGSVWRNNCETYESQEKIVRFETFIEPLPNVGWEIIED